MYKLYITAFTSKGEGNATSPHLVSTEVKGKLSSPGLYKCKIIIKMFRLVCSLFLILSYYSTFCVNEPQKIQACSWTGEYKYSTWLTNALIFSQGPSAPNITYLGKGNSSNSIEVHWEQPFIRHHGRLCLIDQYVVFYNTSETRDSRVATGPGLLT